jgi:hypothetical protein
VSYLTRKTDRKGITIKHRLRSTSSLIIPPHNRVHTPILVRRYRLVNQTPVSILRTALLLKSSLVRPLSYVFHTRIADVAPLVIVSGADVATV